MGPRFRGDDADEVFVPAPSIRLRHDLRQFILATRTALALPLPLWERVAKSSVARWSRVRGCLRG